MCGDHALVGALVLFGHVIDSQPPIVGVLEIRPESLVTAVRVHSDGEQQHLIRVHQATHPRHGLVLQLAYLAAHQPRTPENGTRIQQLDVVCPYEVWSESVGG